MKNLQSLKNVIDEYDSHRQQLIKDSSDILKKSKKAVFEMHRDNFDQAKDLLDQARDMIGKIEELAKDMPALAYEGSFNAALEEFVESRLFYTFLIKNKLDLFEDIPIINYTHYIGGLCDFTGELARKSTLLVIKGNPEPIKQYYEFSAQIMAEILELNLTGYLRKKFDEMKRNVRNLERILYDITLK